MCYVGWPRIRSDPIAGTSENGDNFKDNFKDKGKGNNARLRNTHRDQWSQILFVTHSSFMFYGVTQLRQNKATLNVSRASAQPRLSGKLFWRERMRKKSLRKSSRQETWSGCSLTLILSFFLALNPLPRFIISPLHTA